MAVSPSSPATKKQKAAGSGTKPAPRNVPPSAADIVDQQLARYRAMRNFAVTAEPSGAQASPEQDEKTIQVAAASAGSQPFVIQKHAASHLHYDFRLGWNGVLKSWAVAKGPSYSPKDRRLAVQVEDHPMEYGGFEGVIPQGQYGGGTVMVWDQGTWAPQPGQDVDAGLRDGSLKFFLDGKKMHGKWTLVRMNGSGSGVARWKGSSKPNWLLIKEHDDFEYGSDNTPVTNELPNSAVTNRTMDEIARQEDHIWNSKDTATGEAWVRKDVSQAQDARATDEGKTSKKPTRPGAGAQRDINRLPTEAQPDFIKPQLAGETEAPPSGQEWLHELKLDGYRIQARKRGSEVTLFTRSGLDWTHRMSGVAQAIASLPVGNATFDGEAVVLHENGTSSFAALQAALQQGARRPITYFCFDLLHIEGRNPRELPLERRKEFLAALLSGSDDDSLVRLSEHLRSDGKEVFRRACELRAEGIVSKRADSWYESGRGRNWLKAKCLHEQEFVIGGYTLSSDGDDRIGSLLLGYYEGKKLIYAGRTGTGFTQKTRRELMGLMKSNSAKVAAFERVPVDARRGAIWVEPTLLAQVRFATWTADNLVRQAAFLGLREDKEPQEVTREAATAPVPKRFDRAAKNTASTVARRSTPQKSAIANELPIRLTHPNKIVDPETQLTKAHLAEYYWAVADRMLPHVAARPLSLVRCPEGVGKPCFYQKHANHMLPPGVTSVNVPDKRTGFVEPYITLDSAEAIAGLAQMGVLEVHPWGSRNDDLERPDRVIFDLDPDEGLPWSVVCEAAAEMRSLLKERRLESFLKTTGGKGLHVVLPIVPQYEWPQVKEWTRAFVTRMERSYPTLYLTKMSKAARRGKIYLDYLRNERGATAVAPYSPRARLGTHVSLPLPWTALREKERPVFSVEDFGNWKRILRTDPWKKLGALRQQLESISIE